MPELFPTLTVGEALIGAGGSGIGGGAGEVASAIVGGGPAGSGAGGMGSVANPLTSGALGFTVGLLVKGFADLMRMAFSGEGPQQMGPGPGAYLHESSGEYIYPGYGGLMLMGDTPFAKAGTMFMPNELQQVDQRTGEIVIVSGKPLLLALDPVWRELEDKPYMSFQESIERGGPSIEFTGRYSPTWGEPFSNGSHLSRPSPGSARRRTVGGLRLSALGDRRH